MSTVGTVENFERAELVTFTTGKKYETTRWSNHWFTLEQESLDGKPSGVQQSTEPVLGKVLSIADRAIVRLSFKHPITRLSWKQMLITDFTQADLQAEYPELVGRVDVSKLTHDDFETFLAVYIDGETTPTPLDQIGSKTLKQIEFRTTRAGSVHIDEIRWFAA